LSDHVIAFAPGRVNLIGEHTDYNQGLALPFAIGLGVTVRAEPLAGARIEAVAADLRRHDAFALDDVEPASGWRGFVRGAAGELARAGIPVPGATLTITGDVPRGSGLSSSAALEIALTLALLGLAGREAGDRIALAKLCSAIENHWVGARTGLLDQLASLFGERDRALRIDFRTLDVDPIPLELGGYRLVTLDSGERHSNAASGYNRRRRECAAACAELGLASLRDATAAMVERLPPPLDARARHIVTENARVEAAVAALGRGDLPELGRLLDASHASLRDDFEISTPAVERAVGRLRASGAIGARIVGGGFGGHVLGLLPADARSPDGALAVSPSAGARRLR
jgi:galactokinase